MAAKVLACALITLAAVAAMVSCDGVLGIDVFDAATPPVDAASETRKDAAHKLTIGLVDTLGQPCTNPGATACAGNDSQVVLVCQAGAWASVQACSATQRCDSTAGACADIVPACVGLAPGDSFCSSGAVMECGVNLVTTMTLDVCGPRQTCEAKSGSASCVCKVDPLCAVGGATCADASVMTCAADTDGCFYAMLNASCSNGACYYGDGGASCCVNGAGCTSAGLFCANATTTLQCVLGPDGCLMSFTAPCPTDFPNCTSGECT